MPDELVDRGKFDAILRRLIQAPPTSLEKIKAEPKLKKDGTPKKTGVRKADKGL